MNIVLFIAGIALCLPTILLFFREDILDKDFGEIFGKLVFYMPLAGIGITLIVVAVVRHFN